MTSVGDSIAGRYTLRELFLLGGEGMVWRATDEDLRRDVVLKCPRPDDADSAERLRTAARNAARLRHPHLVGVHDILTHEGVCWLVMEYVPGRSLAEIARRESTLGPRRAAAVGEQIAGALAHCHEHGILHCDVSPENIIVTEADEALLTDFGSSLDVREATTGEQPAIDVTRGKWQYVAPEIERGTSAGPKSDVYALGATLLAVTERRRHSGPFEALLAQLMRPHPNQRPTAASAAARFARVERPAREWDRAVLRRAALGAVEIAAVALTVVAGVAVPVAGAADPIGDPRSADPCALLDPSTLSGFGRIDTATDDANFDTCDLRVRQWGEDFHPDIGHVRLTLSADAPERSSQIAYRRTGNVTVAAEPAGATRCVRTLIISGSGNIEIIGERKTPDGPDPCALADATAAHARDVVWHGPIPRRPAPFPPTSLARHEACGLVDAGALAKVAGIDAVHPAAGFGNWSCRWDSTIDGHVTVRFDRDPVKTAAAGQPLTLSGFPGFRRSGPKPVDDCVIQLEYRPFRGPTGGLHAEVVVIRFTSAQPPDQRCATVTDLATTVATNLTR
ncbi:serine/threonine-protein kinase [Nocardia transvalensis]|uniref:non-specific serine/threonine protein kinase n=1 Tax=Nocardia transvalensis TaxID=37333 RepID=A0A7W9UNH6_9NOCA|nr:serine/threonine-protein kinase [Nocardia transvalensis]MBB5918840.1 serine/threonine-protein kinase [Nocardia transvalensis]